MSLDLAGPYQVGRDLGTGKSCRYMVAVVPIPVLHELSVAHEIRDLQPEDVEEAPEHPEEEETEEPVEDVEQDVVNALNEKANIEEMAEPASVQNVTLMEPVQSRHVDHLVAAMSKLHAKYRMLGVNVMRLRTDREKSFLHAKVQRWCEQHQLVQTMTSGDDPAGNGRCEIEVGQLKRRLRLMLVWGRCCTVAMCSSTCGRREVPSSSSTSWAFDEANAEVWCSSGGEGEKKASPGPTFVQSFQVDAVSGRPSSQVLMVMRRSWSFVKLMLVVVVGIGGGD